MIQILHHPNLSWSRSCTIQILQDPNFALSKFGMIQISHNPNVAWSKFCTIQISRHPNFSQSKILYSITILSIKGPLWWDVLAWTWSEFFSYSSGERLRLSISGNWEERPRTAFDPKSNTIPTDDPWENSKRTLALIECSQKYSRLSCLLRVKGLVNCFYLGWSGSTLLLSKHIIKVGLES